MEEIMDFLVENYIYVAAISGFLIVVLLGVIIAGSKKRKKAQEPDMVSMSDVNTGSINDVAMNLNMPGEVKPTEPTVPTQESEVAPMSNVGPTAFAEGNPINGNDVEPVTEPAVEPTEPVVQPVEEAVVEPEEVDVIDFSESANTVEENTMPTDVNLDQNNNQNM
jgi:hypothetical protein